MNKYSVTITNADGRRRDYKLGPEMVKAIVDAMTSGREDYVSITIEKVIDAEEAAWNKRTS